MARRAMPQRLRPMLARPGRLPPEEQGWAFEIKWDGVRAIAYWHAGQLRLESRNLNDVSARYPELRALGEQLGEHEVVLDGEIVAFEEHGVPSFELLQRRMHVSSERAVDRLMREQPVTYLIFDLLYLDGTDTMRLPYEQRRELLEQLALEGGSWQTPRYHRGEGDAFLRATARHGLEGALAKRLSSPYRPGERRGDWLKIKNSKRQELVIGGWLPGKGKRAGGVGALLLGHYEQPGHQSCGAQPREGVRQSHGSARKSAGLRFAGRVGTGFDEAELRRLSHELRARARKSSPFSSSGVQPPKDARFVVPELVAEIEFSAWTQQGVLRHPIYRGLRDDKPAAEVLREGLDGDADRDRGPSVAELAPDPAELAPNTASRELTMPAVGSQLRADETAPQARTSHQASSTKPDRSPTEHAPYRVLRETSRYADIEVQGRRLRLSNRRKTLYPRTGFTKGDLIDYYGAVAPVVLAHLRGRALTLKRYPDGVEGECFYEKNCPSHRPEWVRTVPIWSERVKRMVRYCLVEDLSTLLWISNLANIELHTSLALARNIECPTMLVFDLDPGAPAGLRECCRVALRIRELLGAFELRTLVKTSGSKGLQVYLPLNTPVTYEHAKPFARAVAELLEKRHPKEIVSHMAKRLRRGKVFIDWSQNDEHKTTVCAYSLRAGERPLLSTPLDWGEVERCARRRSAFQLSAGPDELLARVEDKGDLFAPLLTLEQRLPALS